MVLSEPTSFLGALWIPHIRNNTAMEAVLASDEARDARCVEHDRRYNHEIYEDIASSHTSCPKMTNVWITSDMARDSIASYDPTTDFC